MRTVLSTSLFICLRCTLMFGDAHMYDTVGWYTINSGKTYNERFDSSIFHSFSFRFAAVLKIIVLTDDLFSANLQLSDRCSHILQHFGIHGHDHLSDWKVPRSFGTSPNHHPSISMSNRWQRCWEAVFASGQTWCALQPNISPLVSSVQRALIQNSCDLFWYNFANLRCAVMFVLEKGGVFLATHPNKSYLFSHSLISLSETLTCNMLLEAYLK